jgi:hypothetical protein
MAVILFPAGPVTDTHRPQFAELSQLESVRAVPKIPAGSVYVENEQVPPARFPPYTVASPENDLFPITDALARVKAAVATKVYEKSMFQTVIKFGYRKLKVRSATKTDASEIQTKNVMNDKVDEIHVGGMRLSYSNLEMMIFAPLT